jgi:hypothetical protein
MRARFWELHGAVKGQKKQSGLERIHWVRGFIDEIREVLHI